MAELNVILLHQDMVDKRGDHITTSLTLIDMHDISRSCKTYGVKSFIIAHPSPALRRLAGTLRSHWEEGYGSTYNPDRKEALSGMHIVETLDQAINLLKEHSGKDPLLIATSAKEGADRISFSQMKNQLGSSEGSYLLMLGTGHGMSDQLLERADLFLEPIRGNGTYNHLSVRSACAIMLDRISGPLTS